MILCNDSIHLWGYAIQSRLNRVLVVLIWVQTAYATPSSRSDESQPSQSYQQAFNDQQSKIEQEEQPNLKQDSVTVIAKQKKSKVIRNITHVSTADLLQDAGGLPLSNGGSAGRLELSLRGSGAQQVGLFLEGIPLHNIRRQSFDLSILPLGLIDALSVGSSIDESMTSGVQGGRAILHLPSSQDSNPTRINMTVSSEQTAQLDGRIQTSVQQNQLLIGGGISGGPGEFRYMDQAGIDRIRQENSHIRTGGFARWTHSDIRHFKGIIGLSIIEREEPGPEGFTLPGRRSKQQLLFESLSGQIPLSSTQLKLQQYAALHSFRFTETEPLWQSRSGDAYRYQDWRIGTDASVDFQITMNTTFRILSDLEFMTSSSTLQEQSGINHHRMLMGVTVSSHHIIHPYWFIKLSTRIDHNTERSPILIPAFSLNYRQKKQECAARFSRSFRDPGFDERFLTGPGLVANPDLQTEDGAWADLGCRLRYQSIIGQLSGGITLFAQQYKRLIIYIPLDPYRIQAQSNQGAELYGIELNSKYKFKAIMFNTRLTLLNHSTTESPIAPLPLRPKIWGTASILYRLTPGILSLRYNGRSSVTTDRFGFRTLPHVGTFDLTLARAWKQVSISLSIRNILDQIRSDYVLRPLPGRSVWLSSSLGF